MRSHHGYSHCHLLVQSSILLFLGTFAAAQAASDILIKGTNLTDGETLVSANGSFTLGFFSRGLPARRYLGSWFTQSNSSSDAVCWVANRDRPLGDTSGVLVISDTGSLVLLDGSGRTAWSSNTTAGAAASLTVKLLESGNLVLLDGNNGSDDYDDVVKLWQSFDHPTNTLLPGAKIGINLWSGGGWSLTSWRDADDPSPGEFRYAMVRRGGLLPEIVMLDSSDAIRYRTGVWNGRWFSGVPEMYYSYSDRFVYQVTESQSEVSFSYAARPGAPPSLSRVVLNYTGQAVRAVWEPDNGGWIPYFKGPRDDCDHYNTCGHSGACNQTAASTAWPCSCVQGFVPVSPSDWDGRDPSGGCRRNVPLDCGDNGTTDGFVRLPGVKLPDTLNSSLDTSITLDECMARCLANCSCVAYAAADVQGGGDDVGTGCIMWPENLTDLRYVAGGQTLYLRQATAATPATPASGKRRLTREQVALRAGVSMLGFTGLAIVCLIICNGREYLIRNCNQLGRNLIIQMTEAVETVQDPSVSSIALATVRSATRNFSTRNMLGEGTFGIVYEGKLPIGHPLLHGLAGRTIAVKRLKPIGGLPDMIVTYFTREMQLMSGLKQHRNVLRLLAYCNEDNERILVYEYMHRSSLDSYIFGTPRERARLNWRLRLQIIQGIADGVKHLHEGGSAGNVIHRDLKPANVLLDGGWQAKVADFGTAKLLVAGATGTRTRIGTPGYMAPEYVLSDGGETTLKCDVYSFGVTLLETLSGRRNCDMPSLVSEAWRLWVGRCVTVLLDPAVAPAPAKPELAQLSRCIQVGLLCVQEKPDGRPTMSAVVEMLGSPCSELAEPMVPMVVSNGALARLLEADLSRPTVYETIDFS